MAQKIYGQVHQCQRINGSVNGNPNWGFVMREFDENNNWTIETRRTKSDISDSYGEIPNKIYSKMPEFVSVEYTLTKSGRISSIRVIDGREV